MSFVTKTLSNGVDVIAPDQSQIRLLPIVTGGSMAHCTLPVGKTSLAVTHRHVEEIWYILSGQGELWRKLGDDESVTPLEGGVGVTIPVGAHFQFRTVGPEPLQFILVTMPPWPGAEEAVRVADHWATD